MLLYPHCASLQSFLHHKHCRYKKNCTTVDLLSHILDTLMYKKNAGFYKTLEFEKWFNAQPQIDKWYILESFSRIMADGYFDDHRWLGDGLWELKWQNGRRVYYGYIPSLDIVVVLGGNKNDQKRDIARAKKIFKKFQEASKKQCFGTDSF